MIALKRVAVATVSAAGSRASSRTGKPHRVPREPTQFVPGGALLTPPFSRVEEPATLLRHLARNTRNSRLNARLSAALIAYAASDPKGSSFRL